MGKRGSENKKLGAEMGNGETGNGTTKMGEQRMGKYEY